MPSPGFVIGGGPSLRGFDFERLRGQRCLAVNVAFRDVPWAESIYIGDTRLLTRVFDSGNWKSLAGRMYTRANRRQEAGVPKEPFAQCFLPQHEWATDPKGIRICDRGQSGLSAVNLAELLGYDPIFLLGFDCKGTIPERPGLMANYHDRYPKDWNKPEAHMSQKFTAAFDDVKDDIRAKVYNCSPDSALECFEKITFEKAMEICKGNLSRSTHSSKPS